VYIGAPKFGARAAAGNSIPDIKQLVKYAHRYWARVYITVNTLIYDNELDDVQKLIKQLYNIGSDAIIIQDLGILELDIPPIPVFASTQTHNITPEKVKFLEQAGFSRVILARELSLMQIKEIKHKTNIGLEFFIHGALCVCYSGQCYFSFASTGRSANRGECSQPCRMMYDLVDSSGKIIAKDKHLLSLKDLNLSLRLNDLIEAGITSFKIEGRLKDINYVKNVTSYYRQSLDAILSNNLSFKKASSGYVKHFFTPDLEKSFNRGFTDYFIDKKNPSISSFNSPKSIGQKIGSVVSVKKDYFIIKTEEPLSPGDGLCFFTSGGVLTGFNVNKVDGNKIFPNEIRDMNEGAVIYRNSDYVFEKSIASKYAERKISAVLVIEEKNNGIFISASDEDNNRIEFIWDIVKQPAENPGKAAETMKKQLGKTGDSIFTFTEITLIFSHSYFFPISSLNELRRNIIEKLETARASNRPVEKRIFPRTYPLNEKQAMDYRDNVTNIKASEYLRKTGAEEIEPGFELQNNFENKALMTCKYCIRNELSLCPLENSAPSGFEEPFYLIDKNRKYRLHFDCKKCEMSVLY